MSTIEVYIDADNRDGMSDFNNNDSSAVENIGYVYVSKVVGYEEGYMNEDDPENPYWVHTGWVDGHYREAGLQFPLTIAQSETINSCILSLVANGAEAFAGNGIVKVCGILPDVAVFNNSHTHRFSTGGHGTLTTAYVNWQFTSPLTGGTRYNSPDIKTVLQEIVNHANWDSGHYAGFVLFPDLDNWTDGDGIRFKDYSETTETNRGRLNVNYGGGDTSKFLQMF